MKHIAIPRIEKRREERKRERRKREKRVDHRECVLDRLGDSAL